jgi:hypothetical protein
MKKVLDVDNVVFYQHADVSIQNTLYSAQLKNYKI